MKGAYAGIACVPNGAPRHGRSKTFAVGFTKKGCYSVTKNTFAHPSQILRFCRLGFPCVALKLTRFGRVGQEEIACSTSTFLANTLIRMRFQSRRDPKGASRVLQVRRILGQDEVVTPWGSSCVLTLDRAARTPRDILARVRSLARHATRAFVKRRTRLPRLVLRGP